MTAQTNQDLVLVGGGHSHALALRMLAMKPVAGLRLTLVSPDSLTAYSGMLPGLVAGHYQLEETHIDLRRLCQACDCRFIRASVTALDRDRREIALSDGTTLNYDWLSLDIGALPNLGGVPGAAEHAVPVKPVANFQQRWHTLLDELKQKPDAHSRLVVVGGGAGGTEMAMALAAALKHHDLNGDITVVTRGPLLSGFEAKVRDKMRARLAKHDIAVLEHSTVDAVSANRITVGKRHLDMDFLLWCTGVTAQAFPSESGLACDEDGFVSVAETLQSLSDPRIFAAGDCAAFTHPLPKAGVYAVRQAKTLAHNLAAAVQHKPLQTFRPQRKFLSLLSAGGQDAVAARGSSLSLSGSWIWHWKDRIDKRFMDRFDRQLPTMAPPTPGADDSMRCAGCGAKVGGNALREALNEIKPVVHADIDAGVTQADDAAIIRWPGEQRLVQSVDYFPAFIDEPYLFGRIAALHSLSDLHAMNARPHSALATVAVPWHHPRLQGRDLKRLMQGALRELNDADCALVGGHSVEGPQMAAGFTVNGQADPNTLWHKGGAHPDDDLILTKPLGTGIQLASLMQGLVNGTWLDAALQSMLQSNALAQRAVAPFQPTACTDVTGFGLLGHLLEICQQSHVHARIYRQSVPVLAGTDELLGNEVRSSLSDANLQVLSHCDTADTITEADKLILTDPQTSGGLLIALPPQQTQAALKALQQYGVDAWRIGYCHVKKNKELSTITVQR